MNAARTVMISAYARGFVPGIHVKLEYIRGDQLWLDAGRETMTGMAVLRLAICLRRNPLFSLWSPIV